VLAKRDTSLEMKTSLEELSKKVSALSTQTAEADKARATADAALKARANQTWPAINTNLLKPIHQVSWRARKFADSRQVRRSAVRIRFWNLQDLFKACTMKYSAAPQLLKALLEFQM
jgi:hypothetical protein